jgi:hypothetical protein
MKNDLKFLLIFVVWFVILYLFGAFVSFEFNASNWSGEARFFLVFFTVIAAIIVYSGSDD